METIFDHNPTEQELDVLFASREDYNAEPSGVIAYSFSLRQKENYLKYITEDAPSKDATRDAALSKLTCLFLMREGVEKAKEYVDRIKDPLIRIDWINLLGGF